MYYTYLDTPIGHFLLAGDNRSLSTTSFTTGKQARPPHLDWIHDRAPLGFAIDQLEQYFAGERTCFELPLAITGTHFQQQVWRQLQAIPFGETRSYGDIARALDKPGASRAVGTANAANILPLIIPCHRVIGADGTLTGFGGGLETKRWLLDFEGALPPEQGTLFG